MVRSPMPHDDTNLQQDLDQRIRARGVRVEERRALLRLLAEPQGADELRERIEALERRIESAAARVRGAVR